MMVDLLYAASIAFGPVKPPTAVALGTKCHLLGHTYRVRWALFFVFGCR